MAGSVLIGEMVLIALVDYRYFTETPEGQLLVFDFCEIVGHAEIQWDINGYLGSR